MIRLKATSAKNGSEAIVVSFENRWLKPLDNNAISVVFRKRGPKSFDPEWIYVYCGSPTSAIVGRMKIENYQWLSIRDAIKFAKQGQIASDELREYAQAYDKIAVFTVGSFEAARNATSRTLLNEKFEFYPPQSFLRLSKEGRKELDNLCGFRS